ncbi:MAG: hypothetical protein ACYC2H_11685 [Thermoplasmatota archaeon]
MLFRLALMAILLVLAGCASPSTAPDALADAERPFQVRLHCMGEDGGLMAMEASWFGSCWGHVGHHTYLLPEPVVVHAMAGTFFAVEVTGTTVAGPAVVTVQASLDGLSWTLLGEVPYASDVDDRNEIAFDVPTPATTARFVRVAMPPSTHDGLAGYLDHTNLTLTATAPLTPVPPLQAPTTQACATAVLEAFFIEHPCWFGGRDRVDEAFGGEPAGVHTDPVGTEGSYYDSPSFLHTYVVAGTQGAFDATVRVQLWRAQQTPLCTVTYQAAPPITPDVRAEASPDGVQWSTVAEAPGSYTDEVRLEGTIPPGMALLRFGTGPAAGDQVGCHHPAAFLLESGFVLVG